MSCYKNPDIKISQIVPIKMCKKPNSAPILKKSMNEIGDPSRFERLIAKIFAGLPIGRMYPPKFTAMTKAHH